MQFIKDTISDLQSSNQKKKSRILFHFLDENKDTNDTTTTASTGCVDEVYDKEEEPPKSFAV